MLLFTRLVSLGYLFNICVSDPMQWLVTIIFSIVLVTLTGYSCYLTIRLRGKHDNKIQYYQHMSYAQGMGRSSILLISFLLAIDYGIRISTYFQMATVVLQTIICRLAFNEPTTVPQPGEEDYWFSSSIEWSQVKKYASTIVPSVLFLLALPLALKTTVNSLKYFARVLFALSCIVFVLVIIARFLCDEVDFSKDGYLTECVHELYMLRKMASQVVAIQVISTLTQIPNISA